MIKIETLSSEKPNYTFKFNLEKPYLKLTHFVLEKNGITDIGDLHPQLKFKVNFNRNSNEENYIHYKLKELFEEAQNTITFEKVIEFNDYRNESVEFSIVNDFPQEAKIHLFLETIDTSIPVETSVQLMKS